MDDELFKLQALEHLCQLTGWYPEINLRDESVDVTAFGSPKTYLSQRVLAVTLRKQDGPVLYYQGPPKQVIEDVIEKISR